MKIKTKISQSDIARAIGVSQGAVSYWLNLQSRPTGLTKKALEDKFPELAKKIEEAWGNG